jgi:hypothetical protein
MIPNALPLFIPFPQLVDLMDKTMPKLIEASQSVQKGMPFFAELHTAVRLSTQVASEVEAYCSICEDFIQNSLKSKEFPVAQSPLHLMHEYQTKILKPMLSYLKNSSQFPPVGATVILGNHYHSIQNIIQIAKNLSSEFSRTLAQITKDISLHCEMLHDFDEISVPKQRKSFIEVMSRTPFGKGSTLDLGEEYGLVGFEQILRATERRRQILLGYLSGLGKGKDVSDMSEAWVNWIQIVLNRCHTYLLDLFLIEEKKKEDLTKRMNGILAWAMSREKKVFVFLCFCVFVFLCFCVFVFLCFCVFVFLYFRFLIFEFS